MTSTLALQVGLVACAVTALSCGRQAERHHHAVVPGLIAVLAMIVGALLAAILIMRGVR